MSIGYGIYKIVNSITGGVGYSKPFEKYVRAERTSNQIKNYHEFKMAVKQTNETTNKPILLDIDIEKFDYFNWGRPYINCHAWSFEKPIEHTNDLIHCGEYCQCKLTKEYGGEFLGAIGFKDVSWEWTDIKLDSVQNWNEHTVAAFHTLENERLFSIRISGITTLEIANITDKFNIQNVFMRADYAADKLIYKGKSYSLDTDQKRMIKI